MDDMIQAPASILMVRPAHFFPNEQTAKDNAFQGTAALKDAQIISKKAQMEFDHVAATLQKKGIRVHVFEDTAKPLKPDAVFPNNWLSTHADGTIAIYPMYAPIRRAERREDIIVFLRDHYQVSRVIDFSSYESTAQFLEGTGAMVIDHDHHIAYCALSHRADKNLLNAVCQELKLKPLSFSSLDHRQVPIYHTNVMMSVGRSFVMICLESIVNKNERQQLLTHFETTKKTVIELSLEQVHHFAGNVIELTGGQGPLLALSESAFLALEPGQIKLLEQSVELCPMKVPHIELGGGSIRCMIATIHLRNATHNG